MHLQTLVARKDLAIVKGRGIGQPNVYVVTERGLRTLLRSTTNDTLDNHRPRRHLPSGGHTVHELLITELAVAVTEAVRARPDITLPWEERFGFSQHRAFSNLIPDYGFLLRHPRGFLACLVEVTSGEESPTRIGQKLQAYAAWAVSPEAQEFLIDLYRHHGAQQPQPQFRLLVVAHDRRFGNDRARLQQILKEIVPLPRQMRHRIWIATVADLAATRNVDAAIWFRARDLEPQLTEGVAATRRKRLQALRNAVSALHPHRLFPSSEEPTHAAPPQDRPDRVALPPGRDRPALLDGSAPP